MDEVVDIMKTNVEKVLERDQKLSELDDRAGEFSAEPRMGASTHARVCYRCVAAGGVAVRATSGQTQEEILAAEP